MVATSSGPMTTTTAKPLHDLHRNHNFHRRREHKVKALGREGLNGRMHHHSPLHSTSVSSRLPHDSTLGFDESSPSLNSPYPFQPHPTSHRRLNSDQLDEEQKKYDRRVDRLVSEGQGDFSSYTADDSDDNDDEDPDYELDYDYDYDYAANEDGKSEELPHTRSVLRGAGIIKSQLLGQKATSEREIGKVMRGAEIVREQILAGYHGGVDGLDGEVGDDENAIYNDLDAFNRFHATPESSLIHRPTGDSRTTYSADVSGSQSSSKRFSSMPFKQELTLHRSNTRSFSELSDSVRSGFSNGSATSIGLNSLSSRSVGLNPYHNSTKMSKPNRVSAVKPTRRTTATADATRNQAPSRLPRPNLKKDAATLVVEDMEELEREVARVVASRNNRHTLSVRSDTFVLEDEEEEERRIGFAYSRSVSPRRKLKRKELRTPPPPSPTPSNQSKSVVSHNDMAPFSSHQAGVGSKSWQRMHENNSPTMPAQPPLSKTKSPSPKAGKFSSPHLSPSASMTVSSASTHTRNLSVQVPVPSSDGSAAFRHATSAGRLWQTLVGEHVRFPSSWWDGARTPRMGEEVALGEKSPRWTYVARHRIRGDITLNGLVKTRRSAGRILLHVIVRDLMKWGPKMDLAIGCFHPSARGIRKTEEPDLDEEDVRDIWMAIRFRSGGPKTRKPDEQTHGGRDESASLIDTVLTEGCPIADIGKPSPIGDKYSVNNDNVRAIFGDEPPKETVFILESELYKMMVEVADREREQGSSALSPAILLIQEFVYKRKR